MNVLNPSEIMKAYVSMDLDIPPSRRLIRIPI